MIADRGSAPRGASSALSAHWAPSSLLSQALRLHDQGRPGTFQIRKLMPNRGRPWSHRRPRSRRSEWQGQNSGPRLPRQGFRPRCVGLRQGTRLSGNLLDAWATDCLPPVPVSRACCGPGTTLRVGTLRPRAGGGMGIKQHLTHIRPPGRMQGMVSTQAQSAKDGAAGREAPVSRP